MANDFVEKHNGYKGSGVIKTSERTITKPKHYSNLVGFPFIENDDVKLYYTPNSDIITEEHDVNFIRGRKTELFLYPKILLKEQCVEESLLGISYQNSKSIYVNGVFGISFTDTSITKLLYSFFLNDWLTYFLFLTTGAWGLGTRPSVRFKEFLSFPFIEPDEIIKNELINLVNQFLKPFEEYYKQDVRSESLPVNNTILSKINHIINEIYGIKGYEKDLIDYVLNVARYQFQESKQHLLNFTNENNHNRERKFVLKNYASVFLQEFGKIYDDEFMQVEIYSLNHFIAMKFNFLNSKPPKQIVDSENKDEREILKRLANLSVSQIANASDPTKNLFVQKDIKGFEENSFYIIKPNEYKCWHRAIAWYDVAEFKESIQKAELNRLNNNADNDKC
jgi:hypothetical protein